MTCQESKVSTDTASPEQQTYGFQAEVSRLLQLMIHSLYSNREIFLRELISNASDACDKLRFAALDDDSLLADDSEPMITLAIDEKAGTLTVKDNGIGMLEQDVIDNLGTIARSGTEKFLSSLTGDQRKDAQLIGQFGVGFYSAFIVADTVTVETRHASATAEQGVRWQSDGQGEFSVSAANLPQRGTAVILQLRDDAKEFLQSWKVRSVIKQYSDHVAFPIRMLKDSDEGAEKEEYDTLNSATALWQRARQDISDDEYQQFYKHISHDFQDPLTWSHNRVEGKLEYTSLLYVPGKAPFDLYHRDANRGLKLYVQRVFIMDDAEQFLPLYLRFIKGVVDAPNLPLNVSRELLQDYGPVKSIRSALTKRVLQMLKKLSNDDEKYNGFWAQFGQVIKEGVGEDADNRAAIAALLRFASTADDKALTSLDKYLERMPEDQESIYYLLADTSSAARNSPHLEVFRKKGYEVLLLSDPVDEWMVSYLTEYQGKSLVNAARGELALDDVSDEDKAHPLIPRLADVLGEHVDEVRATQRLVDSPACLVLAEDQLGPQMRRMMEAAGQSMPAPKPILEVNLQHPLLQRLAGFEDGHQEFDTFAALLLDQAMLAEGQLPVDPAATAKRMQAILAQ